MTIRNVMRLHRVPPAPRRSTRTWEEFVRQHAAHLLLVTTHLLHDRDSKFCEAFDAVFTAEGVKVVSLPFRAPKANAYAERWVGTVRREVLDHRLILGPRQLERALQEFIEHYHTARPHQGLGQRTPIPDTQAQSASDHSQVIRIDRLGGLIHEYARAA